MGQQCFGWYSLGYPHSGSATAGRRSPEQRGHRILVAHMTTLLGRRWATTTPGGGSPEGRCTGYRFPRARGSGRSSSHCQKNGQGTPHPQGMLPTSLFELMGTARLGDLEGRLAPNDKVPCHPERSGRRGRAVEGSPAGTPAHRLTVCRQEMERPSHPMGILRLTRGLVRSE